MTIATRCMSVFGIVQCRNGHHICRPCWGNLQHSICPTCRVDMSEDNTGRVRVLEDEVYSHPAQCKWPGCQHAGLTLGTKTEHERCCSQKLLSCVCGFTAISAEHKEHQNTCITYHVKPLEKEMRNEMKKIQDIMRGLSQRVDSLVNGNEGPPPPLPVNRAGSRGSLVGDLLASSTWS